MSLLIVSLSGQIDSITGGNVMMTRKRKTRKRLAPRRTAGSRKTRAGATAVPPAQPDNPTLPELLGYPADASGTHEQETVAVVVTDVSAEPLPTVPAASGRPRSEATRLGAKAVGYLKRHARRPYGVRGCDGIVVIARQAWRAALIETEAAA